MITTTQMLTVDAKSKIEAAGGTVTPLAKGDARRIKAHLGMSRYAYCDIEIPETIEAELRHVALYAFDSAILTATAGSGKRGRDSNQLFAY